MKIIFLIIYEVVFIVISLLKEAVKGQNIISVILFIQHGKQNKGTGA